MYEDAIASRFASVEPRVFESGCENSQRYSGMGFVIAASLLVATTFIVPFGDSWTRSSTYLENLSADYVDPGAREGRLDRQLAIGILGIFGITMLARSGGKKIQLRSLLGILFITYLLWCAATCLWSDNFGLTLRRWTALMCEVIAGMAIAKRCSARQFVWIVFTCTCAWLCLGIIAELSLGTFQPWQEGYRFAGIFHPNTMGVNCALLTMAAVYLATGEQRAGKWLYMVAIVASGFLLLTGSRTALAAMLASLAAGWYFAAPSARKLIGGMTILAVAAMGWFTLGQLVLGDPAEVVALGRTDSDASSFTGRVPLWDELLSVYLPPQQLVGYGYGAFWSEDRIVEISQSQGWSVPHAHSTYIDFVLNTGYVGAVLCIAAIMVAMLLASRLEVQHTRAGFGFIAIMLAFVLTGGLIETYLGITWFLSMFTLCGICFLIYPDDRGSAQLPTSLRNRAWLPTHATST